LLLQRTKIALDLYCSAAKTWPLPAREPEFR
jgi:hypothetical protein